jgi:hypothetical protein
MAKEHNSSPDSVTSADDPGDDTGRRFRFQWTYSAIICCSLLDNIEGVEEVFCEQHEDVLIKYCDGAYSGIQIKTKDTDQNLWKTSDEGIRAALTRFVCLDQTFPGSFVSFKFVTNHPLHNANNGQSIPFILSSIKASTSVDSLPGPILKFIELIAKRAGYNKEIVWGTLIKTDANDSLPKIDDINTRLISTLTSTWEKAKEVTYSALVNAAHNLTYECEKAATLAHRDLLPAYLPVINVPVDLEKKALLEGKRITKERLLNILDAGKDSKAILDCDPSLYDQPGVGSTSLLLQKLDAGGFSVTSRNSAKDLRDKADYLGILWTKKYGNALGLQRYNHIKSLVLSDAASAFEENKASPIPFGFSMLSTLRSRFKERRLDGSELFDCSNEHLEGFAYSLSSECKVQWSNNRPWEEQ